MSKTEMRPIKDTIPLEEARAIIDETFRPLDRRERVPLLEANRRVVSPALTGFIVNRTGNFQMALAITAAVSVRTTLNVDELVNCSVTGCRIAGFGGGAPFTAPALMVPVPALLSAAAVRNRRSRRR